ncbi:TPA: hypothetical protein JAN90_02505 [Legionella pneumophila]|nr:hypothetical protein [Legionella pneumophila]HAT8868566.1 hypothetical protein [Legionella pneumophila subsp. pneumophila]HAT7071659.1 hypothetical protein [Legionella pneumophila]HAT8642413.1 hypothetical protein [Legionella pneumophila]HAT8889785.1 hypothetical protein [Legionella pneumophila subsp. pneumophila]HAT8931946.1 hypothetical protein [Legionella pneumophila subsp. pneumophila]
MAKIVYFSFDFDGCFSHETSSVALGVGWENSKSKQEANAAYITTNSEVLEQIRTKKGDQTVLLVGSNRQTPFIDLKNGGKDVKTVCPTGSVFPVMEAITEELGENTTFNPFLLSDLEADVVEIGQTHKKFKEKGYLNDNGTYKPEITNQDFIRDGFPEYKDDESKASLLVAQMKLAAMANPDDEIEFNFYDDRIDIVEGLQNFFKTNPELIPGNVSLNIFGYSGPKLTQVQAQENLSHFILHTTTEFEKLGNPETEQTLNPKTLTALTDAQKNNFPLIFRDPEKNEFKIYRRDIDGEWGFEGFDGVIPGMEPPEKFRNLFYGELGSSNYSPSTREPLVSDFLKKVHFLPIPTTRPSNRVGAKDVYDYGDPTQIVTIKGEGSIPKEVSDWKPLYQALRQSSIESDSGIDNKLSVAKKISLPAFIANAYADPVTPPPLEIQTFISEKLNKMNPPDIASLLIDSKISVQAIEKILENKENKNEIMNQIIEKNTSEIKKQETTLQGELEPEERLQLEASLLELYKSTINLRNRNLLLKEISQSENLRDARNPLCTSIEEAIKSPTLSLDDCQNISKVIDHANIAIDPKVNLDVQFNSICELGELSDNLTGKKSQNLGAVSVTCGILAVVSAIVAVALAPTGIGLIIGFAVAGALAAASISTGIASNVTESDLSKKTRDFKSALEEIREEDDLGEGWDQTIQSEFH